MRRWTAGPWLARLIATVCLRGPDREFIVGDLEELFFARVRREGTRRASRRYLREVIISVAARVGRRRAPGGPNRRRESGWRTLSVELLADLRAGLRSVRRAPGFAMVTIFTLALGVGSTAAVFGMVNQLLLRPLPGVTAAEGAAYLQFYRADATDPTDEYSISVEDFDALRREATLLEGMASYGGGTFHVSTGAGRPIAAMAQLVYGDFFEVLGVRPSDGRLLAAAETGLGADPLVAVISEPLRSSLFGTDDIVGRTMRVNGHAVTVVGVAGGGFAGPERGDAIDVWLPLGALVPLSGFPPDRLRGRESTIHEDMVVRVREGISVAAAEAQLGGILSRLAAAHAQSSPELAELRPTLFPGLVTPPNSRERTYQSLRVLAGVVGLVLLIACANVANLLLVRNVKRRGAVATCRALGASPGRIARQQLVESIVLAALGTAVGLGIAWLIALPFRGEELAGMPAFEGFTVDGRVILFAAAASIATAALFGTLPAALAGRFELVPALRESEGQDTGRLASIRFVLSSGQIAMSLALLVGGLLLLRTVRNLYAVDTGLDIGGVATLALDKPDGAGEAELDAFYRRLLATVARLAAVEAAALDLYGPHGPRFVSGAGLPGTPPADRLRVTMLSVTPGWFELFGVAAVSGRTFRESDWRPGSPGEAVITASLARRLFGRTDVAGSSIVAGFGGPAAVRIVGVVEDIRIADPLDEPADVVFLTYDTPPPVSYLTMLIRTSRFDGRVANDIREAVERMLPDQPVADPVPLTDRVDAMHSERRTFGRLLGLLSALAVLLAAVGLYGVTAFAVAGRRREFGIRLALGAERGRIARLVVRYATQIIGAGIVLGLLGGYALSTVLESRLFGVEPLDVASYAGAALLFAVVAAAACWIPTLAAMRVDPVTTLKEQ
jgi:predicted permease